MCLIQALLMTSCLLTNISSTPFHNPKIKAIGFSHCAKKDFFFFPQYDCPSPWQHSFPSFFSFLHYKGTSEPWIWSSPLGQSWRAGQRRWLIAIVLFSCWLLVFVHLSRSLLLLVCNQRLPVTTCSIEGKHVLWALPFPDTSTFITQPWNCLLPPLMLQQHVRGQLSFTLLEMPLCYPHQSSANM